MNETMPVPQRMIPALTVENRAYWTGGADGLLLLRRCESCRRWCEPPTPSCTACGGVLTPEPSLGTGRVFTFTVNHHQYNPAVPPPYVIAIVELDDQPDLRLPTNIVNCTPADMRCGMRVHVLFEQQAHLPDVFVPVFAPIK